MISKIKQTCNGVVLTIKEGNKESRLIQELDENNITHIIHETKEKTGNITIIKKVEYIF